MLGEPRVNVLELNLALDERQAMRDVVRNCIYGVDIQPIATQIAKLRFFISLIVDQRTDWPASDDAPNRGVRPLPNLRCDRRVR